MGEQVSLKWKDFKNKSTGLLESLRRDTNFTDVTLVTEDGQCVDGHKVLLAGSSQFFRKLLKTKQPSHPLIYMRGVKHSSDLDSILDFVYLGEAFVEKVKLNNFLELAGELGIKGLSRNLQIDQEEAVSGDRYGKQEGITHEYKEEIRCKDQEGLTNLNNIEINSHHIHEELFPEPADDESYISVILENLDKRVKSLIRPGQSSNKGKKTKTCKECGKEGAHQTIKDHVESKHIKGTSLPCIMCSKTFGSRATLKQHIYNAHK